MSSTDNNLTSLETKLADTNWKVRQEAYEQILSVLPAKKDELRPRLASFFPKILAENTPTALEKGLAVISQFLEGSPNTPQGGGMMAEIDWTTLTKNLIEKIYAAMKPSLADNGSLVLQKTFVSADKKDIIDTLSAYLPNKNPKLQIAGINALREIIEVFGPKESLYSQHFPKVLSRCSDPNPNTRGAAMEYVKKLAAYLKSAILPQLKSLKKVQQDEIKSFIEKLPAKSESREVQGASAAQKEHSVMMEEDLWEQAEATKVLHKFTENWTEKLLGEGKWVDKKNLLDVMEKAISVDKIEPVPYQHIIRMLKILLNDSNMAINLSCLSIIKKLFKGMRGKFVQGAKALNRPLLLKLRDRKPAVTESALETIKSSYCCLNLEEVIDEYKDQMKEKNPLVKSNILKVLKEYLVEQKGKFKRSPNLLKNLISFAKSNLNDGAPEVRRASISIFSEIINCWPGDAIVERELNLVDEKKRKKIKDLAKGEGIPNETSGTSQSTLKRSPTLDSIGTSRETTNTLLKKSQSVTKFPSKDSKIDRTPGSAGFRTSFMKMSSEKNSNEMMIEKPVTKSEKAVTPILKKSNTVPNLAKPANFQSVTSISEELSNPMSLDEACQFLVKECQFRGDIQEMLSQPNWKVRQDAIKEIAAKIKTSSQKEEVRDEAVMVLLKKKTNEFKEANINLVKELMETVFLLSSSANIKTAHMIIELILEKTQMGKFHENSLSMISTFTATHTLRKVTMSIIINSKDKSSPRLTEAALNLLRETFLSHSDSVGQLPTREICMFIKQALQNPNLKVRQCAIDLFAFLFKFSKDSFVQNTFKELSSIQQKLVEEGICKLNTWLNTGGDKESLKRVCEEILRESGDVNQEISFQLLLKELRNKKQTSSIPEEYRERLASRMLEGLQSRAEHADPIADCLPLLLRKYKREFEKYLPSSVSAMCSLLKSEERVSIIDSLKTLYDSTGDSLFKDCEEFKSLGQKVKNEIMRTPGLGEEDEPMNEEQIFNTQVSDKPSPFKIIKEPLLDKNSPRKASIELNTVSHNSRNSSPKKPPPNPSILSTDMDLMNPLDSDLHEIKNILRREMGEEVMDRMFSIEKSRIKDAITKVETRMKQSSDLAGFWELSLKWVLLRVFDSSREALLSEFGKMTARLIGFADRSGMHLSAKEAEIIFHIIARIVSNEESDSSESFSGLFSYLVIQEHREKFESVLIEASTSTTFRNRGKVLNLFGLFLKRTKSSITTEVIGQILLLCQDKCIREESTRLLSQLIDGLSPENLDIVNEYLKQTIKSQDALDIWLNLQRQKTELEIPRFSKLLMDLLTDIEEADLADDTKNVEILKKVIDLAKARTPETDDFIENFSDSIIEMLCHVLTSQLYNNLPFEARITNIDANWDVCRATVAYVEKICGNQIILRSVNLELLTDLFRVLSDSIGIVDCDKKRLQVNVDNLYSAERMKARETLSKFLNSTILRLLEGPANKILNLLFGILKRLRLEEAKGLKKGVADTKRRVVVKCLLKMGKILDSIKGEIQVESILEKSMDFMSAYPTYEEIDEDDLSVNAIKSLLNETYQAFNDEVWMSLNRCQRFEPGDRYITLWLNRLSSNIEEEDLIHASTPVAPQRELKNAETKSIMNSTVFKPQTQPAHSMKEEKSIQLIGDREPVLEPTKLQKAIQNLVPEMEDNAQVVEVCRINIHESSHEKVYVEDKPDKEEVGTSIVNEIVQKEKEIQEDISFRKSFGKESEENSIVEDENINANKPNQEDARIGKRSMDNKRSVEVLETENEPGRKKIVVASGKQSENSKEPRSHNNCNNTKNSILCVKLIPSAKLVAPVQAIAVPVAQTQDPLRSLFSQNNIVQNRQPTLPSTSGFTQPMLDDSASLLLRSLQKTSSPVRSPSPSRLPFPSTNPEQQPQASTLSDISQKLSQIRQRYSLNSTGRVTASSNIQDSSKQKKIDDFKERIEKLLKMKNNTFAT